MDTNSKTLDARDYDGAALVFRVTLSKKDNCVVEGESDERFYKSAQISEFRDKDIEYHYSLRNSSENDENQPMGVKAVIDAYRRRNTINKKSKSSAYIIDYDFNSPELYKIEMLTDITTTKPVHSIEAFFLMDENLEKVFRHIGADHLLAKFKEVCGSMLEALIEFYALRSTITKASEDEYLKEYEKGFESAYKDDYIFSFTFSSEGVSFVKSFYDEEVARMHSVVDKHEKLAADYSKRKKIIKELHQIRGKTVLSLLEAFFKHYGYDKAIRDSNGDLSKDIVEILTVDLHPKFISH